MGCKGRVSQEETDSEQDWDLETCLSVPPTVRHNKGIVVHRNSATNWCALAGEANELYHIEQGGKQALQRRFAHNYHAQHVHPVPEHKRYRRAILEYLGVPLVMWEREVYSKISKRGEKKTTKMTYTKAQMINVAPLNSHRKYHQA